MKREDIKKIPHGLYEIYWKESDGGGKSIGAVGSTETGDRWLAPTNWIAIASGKDTIKAWRYVERIKKIKLG